MRIAVIDDEKYSRIALVHQIRQFLPYAEVVEAGSGAQAIELLEKQSFDILFLDVHLGDMEGTTIAALARRLMPSARIIFATAYSEYAVRAFELRADDYLLKPFRDQELTHAVARVCRRMQPVSDAPAPKEKEPEATGYVRQAMDYIAAHYADADISIAVIAEHLRVSEGHLSHVFKKQTGMTVTNYLTKTRIDAAMRMLARDHVKVYEAAAAVGYKDVTYFSATFKKLTGLSPSEVE